MPPNSRRVVERILERIAASEYTLTVHFPAVRPGPTGTGPIQQSASALVPFALPPAMSPLPDDPEPQEPPVSMKCLYLDAAGLYQLRQQRVQVNDAGWNREVKALVRVDAAAVEVSASNTIFDGCAYVTVGDERFKVLGVSKLGASGTALGTYYVYLTGAAKSA